MGNKIFIIGIVLLCFFVAIYQIAVAGDKELLEKLVPLGAYDVVSGFDDRLGLTVVSYKMKLKYPSIKVLEFCDTELKKLEWEKHTIFSIKESDRKWIDFIDGTNEGEPFVHQLTAFWHDEEKSQEVSLLLRYYSYGLTREEKLRLKEPNTDVLNVILNIGPYVEPLKEASH